MAKIAMLVGNPCFPDYRVIKEAESMAEEGHHVRIYCTTKPGVPIYEVVSGVEYMRTPFALGQAFRKWLDLAGRREKRERREILDEIIASISEQESERDQ